MLFDVTLALYCVGALGAVGFLLLHRPTRWARVAAVNAAGWVAVIALTFIRAIVLVVHLGAVRPITSWVDAVFGYGTLVAIDLLVWVRLISYLQYLHRHQSERALRSENVR
jgi:hypothetical protein